MAAAGVCGGQRRGGDERAADRAANSARGPPPQNGADGRHRAKLGVGGTDERHGAEVKRMWVSVRSGAGVLLQI